MNSQEREGEDIYKQWLSLYIGLACCYNSCFRDPAGDGLKKSCVILRNQYHDSMLNKHIIMSYTVYTQ